ncbi:MAG TPA: RNA polymerase sigma factor, partial [Terriglobales bacterium]|nr:RNA polymerase sigma factor [Terriglobales bacterium]
VMEQSAGRSALSEFDELLRANRIRVFRLLAGMVGDRDAAEDLTQECLLRAHQASSGFRRESAFTTWLVRIAINLATDYQRNRRLQFWRMLVRPQPDAAGELIESFSDGRATAERSAIARQQVERVWEAARRLSAQQRAIFLLRFVEEMEISEIAAATDLAEGTVKVHLSRAVRAVRKALQKS